MESKYKFAWNDRLNTGIPWIDSQHKRLLERINMLLNVVTQRKNYDETGRSLRFLEQYVKAHFATEEQFMIKHEYPGYDHHKKEHEIFKNRIAITKKKYLNKGSTKILAIQLVQEMWDWYKDHILKKDLLFSEYLKSKRIKGINQSAEELMDDLMKNIEY